MPMNLEAQQGRMKNIFLISIFLLGMAGNQKMLQVNTFNKTTPFGHM
jgi:hypothetical protein